MILPIRPTARACVVRHDRAVLLQVCRDGRGTFCVLPGGQVEPGESFQQAAARECFEETGYPVAAGDVIGAREWLLPWPDGHLEHGIELIIGCHLDGERTSPGPLPDGGQVGVEWLRPDELAGLRAYPPGLAGMMERSEAQACFTSELPPHSAALPARPSGRAWLLQGDAVLTTANRAAQGGLVYVTPGGGLEPGESLAAAAERECQEETGWPVRAGRLAMVREAIIEEVGRHFVDFVFSCRPAGAPAPAAHTDRHQDGCEWLRPTEDERWRRFPEGLMAPLIGRPGTYFISDCPAIYSAALAPGL